MALIALIPLDGTQLSESAFGLLPLVKEMGIDRIRLVSVWESSWEESESGREQQELDEVTEKGRAFLQSYLEKQAEVVKERGFEVETVVRIGRPADEVLASTDDVDMILIATHGRSGIARWWLGSVADQIIKESACPTLVIGPNVDVDLDAYKLERILVPLDGSETAEQVLPLAAWIADHTGAELDVVRCMSLTSVAYDPGMGMYSGELVTAIEDSVKAYLQQVAEKLKGRAATTTMIMGGAGEMLLEHQKEKPSQLVVATTTGRTGVKRAVLGSVSNRLLHGLAPVLLFRPSDEEPGEIVQAARSAIKL
jgi:nucleotide-binding universal stress UspA family protein